MQETIKKIPAVIQAAAALSVAFAAGSVAMGAWNNLRSVPTIRETQLTIVDRLESLPSDQQIQALVGVTDTLERAAATLSDLELRQAEVEGRVGEVEDELEEVQGILRTRLGLDSVIRVEEQLRVDRAPFVGQERIVVEGRFGRTPLGENCIAQGHDSVRPPVVEYRQRGSAWRQGEVLSQIVQLSTRAESREIVLGTPPGGLRPGMTEARLVIHYDAECPKYSEELDIQPFVVQSAPEAVPPAR